MCYQMILSNRRAHLPNKQTRCIIQYINFIIFVQRIVCKNVGPYVYSTFTTRISNKVVFAADTSALPSLFHIFGIGRHRNGQYTS